MDDETFQHLIVEPFGIYRSQLKPASDCAPGHLLDSDYGRDPYAVDTHVDDFIEQRSGLMQAVIGRSVGGREGSTAWFGAVASAFPLPSDVDRVSDDVAFAELSLEGAIGVGTAAR